MKTIEEVKEIIENSAFNKQKYEVNIRIRKLVSGLMMYIDYSNENPKIEDVFKKGIPDFQRDNNIWSRDMKIKFVENIVKGFKTKFQLFEIDGKDDGCQILDGLQRITALLSFMNNEFKIFDNSFNYDDIKDIFLRGMSRTIVIEIFKFKNKNEVIDFYVEMNENITHSPEDIKKALSFKE